MNRITKCPVKMGGVCEAGLYAIKSEYHSEVAIVDGQVESHVEPKRVTWQVWCSNGHSLTLAKLEVPEVEQ